MADRKVFTDESLETLVEEIKSYVFTAELISLDDIDVICGTTIQVANSSEVTF